MIASSRSLLPAAFEMSDTGTTYDATYAALAERLDAVLVTADGKLARALRAHGQGVSLLADC